MVSELQCAEIASGFRQSDRIRLAAAAFAGGVGIMVMIGWATDLAVLTQLLPGLSAMNPMSAISFIAAGTVLAFHQRASDWFVWIASAMICAIGAAKLIQLGSGQSGGIDQLLFAAKLGHAIGVPPNHMAPNTAFALVLAGLALAASKSRSAAIILASQRLSLVLVGIALFALIGYVLGIVALYEIGTYNAMALHSALVILGIAIGVLSANPRAGLIRVISDSGPAGQLSRIVLPLTVLVPVAVGFLRLEGEKLGFYNLETLDDLVVSAIRNHVLKAERLQTVLQDWLRLSEKQDGTRKEEIRQAKARLSRLEEESANIIKLVRHGHVSPDDRQVAKELTQIASQKAALSANIDLLERQSSGARRITPQILATFGQLIHEKLSGDPSVRKAYVGLLVERVEVGNDEVRISGSKDILARLAASSPFLPAVPKAERSWRATQSAANPSRQRLSLIFSDFNKKEQPNFYNLAVIRRISGIIGHFSKISSRVFIARLQGIHR